MTPANVHDSDVFEQLLDEDELSVFADKGYAKKERKPKMIALGSLPVSYTHLRAHETG